MEQVKLTVEIPAELHRRMQTMAAQRHEPVGGLVRQMIEQYVGQATEPAGQDDTAPAISCSTVGMTDCAEMEAELESPQTDEGSALEYGTVEELEAW